ncbi:MAG TPA: hypothetical protein VKB80_00340, partial [Kofleriaceae bacterium]|nr:hypothetical protein [Kofleriaceae bacterium]
GYELVRRAHTASSTRRELRRAYSWLAGTSPWRERFAALDERPARDLPVLSAADPTGPSGWVLARPAQDGHRPIAAFDGDLLVDEVTESVQVDTGQSEGLGEVTRVEQSPLLGEDDSAPRDYQTLPPPVEGSFESVLDEWIVDDVRIRDRLRETFGDDRERSSSPVDTRFVAGEVEVPAPGSAAGDPLRILDSDHAFTALSRPLGAPEAGARAYRDDITDTSPMAGEDEGDAPADRAPPPPPRAGRAAPSAPSAPPPAQPTVVVGAELRLRVGGGEDTGP